MKFPPISWIIAGAVLMVTGFCIHGLGGAPFVLVGGAALGWGAHSAGVGK